MERDIAVVVDKECTSLEITSIIKRVGKPLLENVELIDRYEGENIGINKCSQAFRLRYRNKDKTLTEEEISPVHEKIRTELVSNLSAILRS